MRVAPYRDLLDAGVTLAFSSDSPCYALSPLWQMWCGVSRATAGGEALHDEQQLRPEEALAAYTRAGAAAIFAEDRCGALTPGRRADFVVLSTDPRRLALDSWKQLHVEAAYAGGTLVDAGSLRGTPPPGRPRPQP